MTSSERAAVELSQNFSDYIVYADESGDHSLTKVDPEFPVFALVLCLVRKSDYVNSIVPAIQRLKFEFFGHDQVILHEHDIRKGKAPFDVLRTDAGLRARFFARVNDLMAKLEISICSSVIRKEELKGKHAVSLNPYQIALLFCMEQLLDSVTDKGERQKTLHVICESRGHKEDEALELEFRRICDGTATLSSPRDFSQVNFQFKLVSKASNSTGLQIADLVARPIALSVLRPNQENRAMDLIRGRISLKVFP